MPNQTLTITPELVKEDGQSRVAKTAGQVGVASSIVTVAEWFAHQAGWHGELPIVVATALVTLLTAAGSYLTNLRRLRGVA